MFQFDSEDSRHFHISKANSVDLLELETTRNEIFSINIKVCGIFGIRLNPKTIQSNSFTNIFASYRELCIDLLCYYLRNSQFHRVIQINRVI